MEEPLLCGHVSLRRAVSFANFGKLRFKSEQDQQIWNECSRVITNCIIYYNTSLLSKVLELKQIQGDLDIAQQLAHISPVAWQHVNFHGRYEFNRLATFPDLDGLVALLATQSLDLDSED